MAAQSLNTPSFSISNTEEAKEEPKPISEMTKAEARTALIAAMNEIRSNRNVKRLANYREEFNAYHEHGNYKIKPPVRPIFVTTFNARQINQAVFMARQRGGFDELLIRAGFRPKK